MSSKRIGAIGLGGMSVFLRVDHFHAPGETLHATGIYSEFGGKAYNQAVAAKRMGAHVSFFGAIGNDDNGRNCRQALEEEGIRPCLQVCDDCTTAYACILTDKDGENRVTVSAGAAAKLSADFIRSQESEIASCGILLLGLECPLEATIAALEIAERNKIYTILNPAPAKPISVELLKRFDLITPNAQEIAALLGLKHPACKEDICTALALHGIKKAAITLGSDGALLWDGENGVKIDAVPTVAVDTTGAGDCFNGTLAVGLISGKSMIDSVRLAVKASAWSVGRAYVMPSLPRVSDIMSVG